MSWVEIKQSTLGARIVVLDLVSTTYIAQCYLKKTSHVLTPFFQTYQGVITDKWYALPPFAIKWTRSYREAKLYSAQVLLTPRLAMYRKILTCVVRVFLVFIPHRTITNTSNYSLLFQAQQSEFKVGLCALHCFVHSWFCTALRWAKCNPLSRMHWNARIACAVHGVGPAVSEHCCYF